MAAAAARMEIEARQALAEKAREGNTADGGDAGVGCIVRLRQAEIRQQAVGLTHSRELATGRSRGDLPDHGVDRPVTCCRSVVATLVSLCRDAGIRA